MTRGWTPASAGLGMVALLAAPAAADELHCLATASLNWNVQPPVLATSDTDPHGPQGWREFWVDTASGRWLGRTIGSAALYSDGGSFVVLADGTAYREHWVGVEDDGGRTGLRIDLTRQPATFLFTDRDGFADTGTCVPNTDGQHFDGMAQ